MRDDLLKEQLQSYARDGAEEAFQPSPGEIHRRARRHYRRMAALAVTGALLAGGVTVGIGLRRASSVPTVMPATAAGDRRPADSGAAEELRHHRPWQCRRRQR